MNNHLTHQQLCDLLIDTTPDEASSAHLVACPACSAEFSALNSSLVNFRQASIQMAEQTIDHRPLLLPAQRTRRFLAIPAYVAAAAALAVAIIIPLLPNTRTTNVASDAPPAIVATAHNTESDEALFEEIHEDVAAPVPGPLEPLANPTGQGSTR
jgi:hypothetical protein